MESLLPVIFFALLSLYLMMPNGQGSDLEVWDTQL